MFISRCFGICNNYNKLLLVQTVASPNPLFSYFFIFPGSDVCERARVYVCAGMHERICLVVVCHGIHRLFAGNAEGVVFSGAFIWGRFQSLTPLFSLLPPFSLSLPFRAPLPPTPPSSSSCRAPPQAAAAASTAAMQARQMTAQGWRAPRLHRASRRTALHF